jgi:hypothetical protein
MERFMPIPLQEQPHLMLDGNIQVQAMIATTLKMKKQESI